MTPKNIKKLRLKLGMTQIEFGKLFGLTSRTISRWENGHERPKFVYVMMMKNIINNA